MVVGPVTWNAWVACGAAVQFASPPSSAWMVHVPVLLKDTVPASIVQTFLGVGMEKETGRPDVAIAVGVYVAPPTFAFVGAAEVNAIVCAARSTCWVIAPDVLGS